MAQSSSLLTGPGTGPGDSFYRQVLTRNIGTLIEDLEPLSVLDALVKEDFIPFTQLIDIQEQLLTSHKNRKIVDFVITRGRDGYQNFKKCLIKCGQKHIADSLERAETELRRAEQLEQTQRASGEEITHRVPTDRDLLEIAQHIGNNWEFVGARLKIPAPKIDQIKLDNPTTDMRIYNLLYLWRNSEPNSNTLDKLLAVLQDLTGSVTINLEKIQDIVSRRPERGGYSAELVRKLTETINTLLDTDPDLTDIIESDKLLSPMWKAMNRDTSGLNGTVYIRSNRPVWITKMKMFLELADKADKNNLSIQWQTIEETFTQYEGEISLDEPLKREQKNIENGDWDYCVDNDCKLGIVYMMKKMGFLPDRQRLNKACKTFGRKSTIMRIICRLICNEIKSSPDDVVWPVYKEKEENDVIFVTICKDQGKRSKHNIMYWSSDYINSENKEVITNEVESNTRIDSDEMKQMKITINANSQRLREHHSNIAMVTASPFRSKGYKTERKSLVKENCIVILVPIKGLIPLQEDVFDRTIGNYKIDIREGIFKWHVGGEPSAQHANIKIGCAIGSETKQDGGTLGGFIEHPVHGLCGLTCAHVILDEEEIRRGANVDGRICVQPDSTSAAFGTLVTSIFRDSNNLKPGLDIALIKLDQRLPDDGNFPDTETIELTAAGFNENDEIKYTSGKICSDLDQHRDKRIVKYGATTRLRRGVFGFDGLEFACGPVKYFDKPHLFLSNQIQIYDIAFCGQFSDNGDSGSLVFMVSGNELEAVGILLGGADGFSVMTPIRDVLLGLGCREPLAMKTFQDNNIFREDILHPRDDAEPMEL